MRREPSQINVRARLAERAKERGAGLAPLSRMIHRQQNYLSRFVKVGRPERLEEDEITSLAYFLGVERWELGGH